MKIRTYYKRLLATAALSILSMAGPAMAQSVIVDNASTSGVTISGSWTASTSAPGQYYGSNYLHDGDTGQGTKSVRFTPNLPYSGSYQVYGIWNNPGGGVRATNVPIDIVSKSGTTTLLVNQQLNAGAWTLLGTYDFNAGTGGSVLIRNTSANGYVIADAVDFVPVDSDFTIHTQVSTTAPPRFGFNLIQNGPGSNIADNALIRDGGFGAYDLRMDFYASDNGAADGTTLIATGSTGTGWWNTSVWSLIQSSTTTGPFIGAQARVYRFTSPSGWSLVRTGTVSKMNAVGGSSTISNNTITLSSTGAQCLAGDAIWLSKDAVYQSPYDSQHWKQYLDPQFTYYNWSWNASSASQSWSQVTDVPSGEVNGQSVVPPLSLMISNTATGVTGIWQNMTNFGGTNTNVENYDIGHTYQVSVYLKQTGISGSSATFTCGSLSGTFTAIPSTWKKYTMNFPSPGHVINMPVIRLQYNGPGTLWVNQFQFYDLSHNPFTLDPRVLKAFQDFNPGTIRIWSGVGNNPPNYTFWSLDSWLEDESIARGDIGLGEFHPGSNSYNTTQQQKLPSALALAKQLNSIPWLICNMGWTEKEWYNFIDYLAAPAGVGYATHRPSTHPGPYTADFSKIYVEVGNESWGTTKTAMINAYGQYAHYMFNQATSGKSYYDPAKIRLVLNGSPSGTFGETAIANCTEGQAVDHYLYTGNGTPGDAGFQVDLLAIQSYQSAIAKWMASAYTSGTSGHPYEVLSYEGGPGSDDPGSSGAGDHSLAAGVGTLDTYLCAQQQGMTHLDFFSFRLGTGLYTSHSRFAQGFNPTPVWEALQMRNQYCAGDIVATDNNLSPTTTDGNNTPLNAVYTFHEVTGGTNYADIVVVSRDLNNDTSVALHLPAAPTASATRYTLTGDPRSTNDTGLTVPITTSTIANFTRDYTFTMPAGSVYLFKIPTAAWLAASPKNLAVTGTGTGYSSLTLSWSPVTNATSYKLYRSTNAASLTGLGAGTPYATVTGTSYTDTSVSVYRSYYYKVSAVVAGVETDLSPAMKASAPPVKYECESLALGTNSGAAYTPNYADSAASGGYRTVYASGTVGDYMSYTVNAPVTGTYDIQLCALRSSNRAIAQISVDGVALSTFDLYTGNSGSAAWKTYDFGNVVLTSGYHVIKFTATDKNTKSTSYSLSSFDYISLTPQ